MTENEVLSISKKLLVKYKLTKWNIRFTNNRTIVGLCDYNNNRIEFSRLLLKYGSKERILDIILHEIAHAIVGPNNGHNNIWKQTAINIGCSGERLCDVDIPSKYIAECSTCGTKVTRNRITKSYACSRCCDKFNKGMYSEFFKLTFREQD